MSVYQAIIVVKGQSPLDLVRISVMAGMEIMNQFDPSRSSYAGDYEHRQFKLWYDEWLNTGTVQKLFVSDDSAGIDEIEMYCNMEGVPTNIIAPDKDTKILVAGPFNSQKLDYFTQNCEKF